MNEIDQFKKQITILEKKITEYESIVKEPAKRGYYALNRILYQQIEYLENFNLKSQIEADPKQDKIYERVTKIWEGLKTMILDCRTLKAELKIPNDEEEKEIRKIYRLTPESISDVLGNSAGQQS